MLSYLRKRWNYLLAKLNLRHEETADPKVQLEQAISEAKDQHRRLREQAANVVANQKQTEMRINDALEKLEKTNTNARQAVLMAEEAAARGDAGKVDQYTSAAQQFADRLLVLEEEIESLKAMHFQATEAADQAKAAVKQNAQVLQKRLSEKSALLSKLDQAKMQETVNSAMSTLNESIGDDVPSFDEVRTKIEARYAKASAVAELNESAVETSMLEIEEAARSVEAAARLNQIKADLGINTAGPRGDHRRRDRRRSRYRLIGARRSGRNRDQIVGVDHHRRRTSRQYITALSRNASDLSTAVAGQAFANTEPSVSTTSTGEPGSNSPSTLRTPAASSDFPVSSARRAPVSTTTRP